MPTPPSPTSSTGPRSARLPRCLSAEKAVRPEHISMSGKVRRQRCIVDKVARMRDQDVGGVAAIDG